MPRRSNMPITWHREGERWVSERVLGAFYFTIDGHHEDEDRVLSLWASLTGRDETALLEHWHLPTPMNDIKRFALVMGSSYFAGVTSYFRDATKSSEPRQSEGKGAGG